MKIENKYLSKPVSVQLEITEDCNHKCPHCYIIDEQIKKKNNKKKNNKIRAIADKIIKNRIFDVIITGGEPLIYMQECKTLITLFKEKKIKVSLNTNLTLIDDEFIAFLKKKSVDSILTSCPSATESIYNEMVGVNKFSAFIRNLAKLNNANIKCMVNMVINKKNINDIFSTAKLLQEIGCTSFAVTPMGFNLLNPRHELYLNKVEVNTAIYELIKINKELGLKIDIAEVIPKCMLNSDILKENYSFLNRSCSAGRTVAAISPNGEVRPCSHNVNSYGNILKEDFKIIWKRMVKWRTNELIPKECIGCGWFQRCNGGCRTNAKALHGEWNSRDPWMTSPLPATTRKSIIPKELQRNMNFRVKQNLVYRQESENSFLFINKDNGNIFVNKLLFDLILDLSMNNEINMQLILKRYGANFDDKSFQDTIKYLISKKILTIKA